MRVGDGTPGPGRPRTAYTAERADEIIQRISRGESLNKICADDHLPARCVVHEWVVEDLNGFADKYTRAQQIRADILADQVLEVSSQRTGDVARDRLIADNLKWMAGRMAPKRWGDRVSHEVGGFDGGAVVVEVVQYTAQKPKDE